MDFKHTTREDNILTKEKKQLLEQLDELSSNEIWAISYFFLQLNPLPLEEWRVVIQEKHYRK